MERTKWIQHCGKVTQLLTQIQQQGSPAFTPEENKHYQELLDANELGLAFELLCWKFGEAGHQISEVVYDQLTDAGSMMDISPSRWTGLKPLERRL
jgi:hypothetical protein